MKALSEFRRTWVWAKVYMNELKAEAQAPDLPRTVLSKQRPGKPYKRTQSLDLDQVQVWKGISTYDKPPLRE